MTNASPEHAEHLAHQFETPEQQFQSGKLGIWLFLGTEILLFSGLFCAYAVYRASHPEVFYYAHLYLSKPLGALNTMVLILSSFTMAAAVRAAQLGNTRWLVRLLAVTLVCAFAFLGVKFIEYKDKWQEGLLTGGAYHPEAPPPGAIVPKLQSRDRRSRPMRSRKRRPAGRNQPSRPAAVGPQGISQQWLTKKPAPDVARTGTEQRADLLRHLFRHDRPARRPRAGRHRRPSLDSVPCPARRVRPRIFHARRFHRPLLAPSGHYMDFPLSAVVFDSRDRRTP